MMYPSKDYYDRPPAGRGSGGQGVEYRPRQTAEDKELARLQCFKYLLFAYNLLIFFCGCVLLGIGVWMAVDRNFITYMVGTDMYAASIYMILVCGGLTFIVSFLGCCGSVTENRCMLFSFFICLCILFLGLLIGGILAGVFRAQIGEAVQQTMADTLTEEYGVNLENRQNRWVTDAWDKAQERLQCCGVHTQGWGLYRQSEWFKRFGAQYEETGISHANEDQKPYVPKSCCVKDRFWRLINPNVCQKWRLGPPGSPDDGAINRALYYDGCYDAALKYISENSNILIGLGISIAILLVGGIILTFYIMKLLRDANKQEAP